MIPSWPSVTEEFWQPFFTGMQVYTRNCSAAFTAMNTEWLGFINRRVEQDVSLPQQLAACKAADEALQVYTAFMQKALTDYQTEFAELAKLGTAAAASLSSDVQASDPPRDFKPRTKMQ